MFLNIYFIDYAITVVPIFLPLPPSTWYLIPSGNPPLSSYSWVMHISSLATPFPILFLTSPCLLSVYQFVLLNPCTFSPILPVFLPITLQMIPISGFDFCSYFFLDSIADNYQFIAILMFIVLIFFFFLNNSL